ncbi:hypothetical protein [Rhizobium wenxiniae]|uniref:hypothetical protein n=1 Tax=Rhizobium wenxiniae TaxID=1737357 RepID=UPI003C25F406
MLHEEVCKTDEEARGNLGEGLVGERAAAGLFPSAAPPDQSGGWPVLAFSPKASSVSLTVTRMGQNERGASLC